MVRNPFRATTNPARDCELMLAKAVLDYEEMTEYTIQGSDTCFRRGYKTEQYIMYPLLLTLRQKFSFLLCFTGSQGLQQDKQAYPTSFWVSDPDPDWIRIKFVFRIWFRTRIQESKNDPQKKKKGKKFHVLKYSMFLSGGWRQILL
jgi:hypothetical protein